MKALPSLECFREGKKWIKRWRTDWWEMERETWTRMRGKGTDKVENVDKWKCVAKRLCSQLLCHIAWHMWKILFFIKVDVANWTLISYWHLNAGKQHSSWSTWAINQISVSIIMLTSTDYNARLLKQNNCCTRCLDSPDMMSRKRAVTSQLRFETLTLINWHLCFVVLTLVEKSSHVVVIMNANWHSLSNIHCVIFGLISLFHIVKA